jgi:hypothetical protein
MREIPESFMISPTIGGNKKNVTTTRLKVTRVKRQPTMPSAKGY